MEPDHSLLSLNRKNLVGALYLGVALVLLGQALGYAQAQDQWWSSSRQLEVTVTGVTFRLGYIASAISLVLVNASISNPTQFGGLKVSLIDLAVYVNSTTKDFSVFGSSQVAAKEQSYDRLIPASGALNISAALAVYSDVYDSLNQFLNTTKPADLRTFTQVDIDLQSSWGPFVVSYCYEKPANHITVCPPPRVAKPSGGGM